MTLRSEGYDGRNELSFVFAHPGLCWYSADIFVEVNKEGKKQINKEN